MKKYGKNKWIFCKKTGRKALTLPELMIAAVILVLVFSSILFSYITCIELNNISRNSSIAVRALKDRLEEIKNTSDFCEIKPSYNNVTFSAAGLTGSGVSHVDDTDFNCLLVTVEFSWSQPNGRIFNISMATHIFGDRTTPCP